MIIVTRPVTVSKRGEWVRKSPPPGKKRARFWLCPDCEHNSRQILARDELLSRRAAFRFVDNLSFLSPSKVRWKIPQKREEKLNPGLDIE